MDETIQFAGLMPAVSCDLSIDLNLDTVVPRKDFLHARELLSDCGYKSPAGLSTPVRQLNWLYLFLRPIRVAWQSLPAVAALSKVY
jgi:hypothetical protein